MEELDLARLRAHCNNISRYRRLLDTNLSDMERAFILRRLAEEEDAAGQAGAGHGAIYNRALQYPRYPAA